MAFVRRHPLWVIVGVGVAIRLVLAFAFFGVRNDIAAWETVASFMDQDPLNAYAANERWLGGDVFPAFPYPPAYLLWIGFALRLADGTGLPFHGVVQLAPILADVAIAVAIYVYLGWRGATERLRLAGASVVMLGPMFIAITGYHGQFDGVAILPAVLGLMAWERRPSSSRAVESGLLIGLGAAIKTVPGLVVLALIPAARSMRERAWLIGVAVAVPVVMFLPFYASYPESLDWVGGYQGVPGRGSLSLVLDPSLAWDAIASAEYREASGLSGLVADNAIVIVAVVVAALTAFLISYRPAPIDAAVVVWLAIYALSPNYFPSYLLWGLPFFIMAGYVRQTAILQIAVLPATVIPFFASGSDAVGTLPAAVYVISMFGLWLFWVAALATVVARIVGGRRAAPAGVQRPLVSLART